MGIRSLKITSLLTLLQKNKDQEESELKLLKKTIDFYALTQKRFTIELDSVNGYMRFHFKVRWNLDRDLYMEGIEKNIKYLKFLLENHQKDYRKHLRRGGIVRKLSEKRI